jgi:hypothetical protein
MRVQDHGDRRTRAGRGAETAFETAFGSGKDYVWHGTCYRSGPLGPDGQGGKWSRDGRAKGCAGAARQTAYIEAAAISAINE